MEGLFKTVMIHAYEVVSCSILKLRVHLVQVCRLKVSVERVHGQNFISQNLILFDSVLRCIIPVKR